ncbi:uncharacterized protein N7483_002590 [Penicillium malachiteum]|uniref:uncharacterized protein n=1 Tax=Penicillium malachiteum TaxID=1324776 RepID=UPI0025486361|nr:uncharacterized protein N7483_002590 [Penicillium malachiteum]KAJ5737465.1 hypothetical protein N7483_002590 [Penicillium malachiteum]
MGCIVSWKPPERAEYQFKSSQCHVRTNSAERRVNNAAPVSGMISPPLPSRGRDQQQPPFAKHRWTGTPMPTVLALEMRRCVSIHDGRALTPFDVLARRAAQPVNVIIFANLSTCATEFHRSPQTVC